MPVVSHFITFAAMKKTTQALLLTLFCTAAHAQHHPVIADMDTRLPLSGVVVSTSNGQRVTTDYTGRFHTQLPFSSATVSKKHYMQRCVGTTELQQDTIFLIPQEVVLEGVVITSPGFAFDAQKATRSIRDNAALPNPNQGFNLLGLFQLLSPSKSMKTKSRAEKIKKILDKY